MKKFGFLLLAVLLIACGKQSAESVKLTILHTNDTHSRVLPDKTTKRGGYARRMGLINKERALDPDMILLDAGDFSQGTPYFNYFNGRVEIEAMNWMKYDAATLGNHEFDNGLDTLAMILKMADFPIVCANYDFTGTPLEGLTQPYVILERKGVKVGVFGLGCYPYSVIDDENFVGVRYLGPSYDIPQQMADTLRAQGCDVVICLSHLGWETTEYTDNMLIQNTSGIDLVLGGHSHTYLKTLGYETDKTGKQVPVDHEGKHGVFVGKMLLTLDKK